MLIVVNVKENACHTQYMYYGRTNHTEGSFSFILPLKILASLKYFHLYKFGHRTFTDLVLKTMVFHRCTVEYYEKIAKSDGVVSYQSRTGKVEKIADYSLWVKKV